jgi:hypothetical protein
MIRIFFTLACLLVAAASARADSLTLSNHYAVVGTNPDGSKYTGTADVQVISDTTFYIDWKIGSDVYKGFGMRQGDVLAATYSINNVPGLVIYGVENGGVFKGSWVLRGKDGNGTEQLIPQ